MTFCEVLATAKRDTDDITAYKKTTYEGSVSYEIVISRDGFAHLVEQAARTTWKKKFSQLADL